jgi:hypothetical protein
MKTKKNMSHMNKKTRTLIPFVVALAILLAQAGLAEARKHGLRAGYQRSSWRVKGGAGKRMTPAARRATSTIRAKWAATKASARRILAGVKRRVFRTRRNSNFTAINHDSRPQYDTSHCITLRVRSSGGTWSSSNYRWVGETVDQFEKRVYAEAEAAARKAAQKPGGYFRVEDYSKSY